MFSNNLELPGEPPQEPSWILKSFADTKMGIDLLRQLFPTSGHGPKFGFSGVRGKAARRYEENIIIIIITSKSC